MCPAYPDIDRRFEMKTERVNWQGFWAHFMIIVMLVCTISTGVLAGSSQKYEAYAQNQSLKSEEGGNNEV